MSRGGEDSATFVIPTETDPSWDMLEGWLHMALLDLPQPVRLRVALVALDLVASARTRQGAPYVVRLSTLDRRRTVVVAVDDSTPVLQDSPGDSSLVLVAALCTRWGVEQRIRARTTWAELAASGAADTATPGEVHIRAPDQPWPRPRPEAP
jgi:hypothetical protein